MVACFFSGTITASAYPAFEDGQANPRAWERSKGTARRIDSSSCRRTNVPSQHVFTAPARPIADIERATGIL